VKKICLEVTSDDLKAFAFAARYVLDSDYK
jgi:hypothetical protein